MKIQLPVNPKKVLESIRNFEKELIQNDMGTLNDLDNTDYFELMDVFNSEKPVQDLGDVLRDIFG